MANPTFSLLCISNSQDIYKDTIYLDMWSVEVIVHYTIDLSKRKTKKISYPPLFNFFFGGIFLAFCGATLSISPPFAIVPSSMFFPLMFFFLDPGPGPGHRPIYFPF